MNKDIFQKIAEAGFEVGVVSDDLCRVYRNTVPSREMVLRLFELLGEDDEICFWNRYYYANPPAGDPGSYVGVIIFRGMAYYQDTRLGTASEIHPLSLPEMADMIIQKWTDTPLPDDRYLNCIYIRYNPYTGREARAEYYMPDIRFDGWMDFADTMIFLGLMMSIVSVILMTVTVKEQMIAPIIMIIVFMALFILGLYMRIEYNRTAGPWRWKKRIDKKQDYRILLKYKNETSELKNPRQARKMLDSYYAEKGRYDIEVVPPMGGIAGLSGYYAPRMNAYTVRFRTVTDRGEQFRYYSVKGRSNEDYLMIRSLLKKKRISLENYGFEEHSGQPNGVIEEPRIAFKEVLK